MRRCLPVLSVLVAIPGLLPGQVTIRRTIPQVIYRPIDENAGLRQRVRRILEREVTTRFEYELFIRDLTGLGRTAAPIILQEVNQDVSDRYVTEALLRLGGEDVRRWVRVVKSDSDADFREAFLTGIPAVSAVSRDLYPELRCFFHDLSPRVRATTVRQLHRLATAQDLLTRCRDMDREVIRAGVETLSESWLFVDHAGREAQNLASFLGILEMHVRDEGWNVGRGFLLALEKDRLASGAARQGMYARLRKLPWFKTSSTHASAAQLIAVRKQLKSAAPAERQAVLEKSLRQLSPRGGAELLLVLGDSPDVQTRLAACKAGLRLLDPELAGAFVHFLKDPDAGVRTFAKSLLESTSFFADQQRRWGPARRL